MQEALRTYLGLALGLTEAPRKRVMKVVEDVVGRGGATAEQVRALTGDLLAMNSANRQALARLVRFEVDKALGKMGLATADEVNELTARVRDLERQLRLAETRAAAAPAAPRPAARSTATLPEAGPVRRVAKKAPAKKATASKATKTATTKATKAPAAKKAPAKKATRKARP